MKTVVLACETLTDEIHRAMQLEGLDYEMHWIESGLHNHPQKLRDKMQAKLDSLDSAERVIATFGLCGNSLIGTETRGFEMVVPRVDDCISLLFGSVAERVDYTSNGNGTYFLTKGWLRGERNIWTEYLYSVEKYGEETAESLMDMMMGHYSRLGIVDTGSYDVEAILPETRMIASKLKLAHEVIPRNLDYLRQLLKGPWPEDRFLVVPPHTAVTSMELF